MRRAITQAFALRSDAIMTPTPLDLQMLAFAIGFLISGTFMRFVWKSPKSAPARKRPPPR